MEDPEIRLALVLSELSDLSFVAHRDLTNALPAITPFGAETVALWAQTGRDLFLHDRDAGKAFLRGSARLAQTTGDVDTWTTQARAFLRFRGSWKALTNYMEQFAEAVRIWGLADAQRWGEIGIAWGMAHLESGEVFFATPVQALSIDQGFAGCLEIAAPLTALQESRGLPPGLALPGALRVRELLGAASVVPWLKRGTDILKSGRLRGEAFFRLEGAESDDALLADLPGFRTAEHERFLTLFGRAALGLTPLFAPSSMKIGTRAFLETDGRTLFMPPAFPGREEALAALLHHTGHLVFGSYTQEALDALFQEAGMRHPPLDADQRVTWRPLFAAFGDDLVRFQLLFDICEDLRIDACIQRGIPNHIPRLLALAAAAKPAGPAASYYMAAIDSLQAALDPQTADARFTPLLTAEADLLTAWRCAQVWYRDHDFPAMALADRAAAYLPGRSPNSQRPVYPRSTSVNEVPEAEEGEGAPAVDALAKKESRTTGGDDPDMEIPPEDTSGSGGRVGVGRPQPAVASSRRRRLRPVGPGTPYPEWDYREKTYRQDWTRVLERPLQESDGAYAQTLLARHAGALRRLRRAIQAEKPTRPTPKRRQSEGEELDLDATVEYVVDRHTGARPEGAIYRQRRKSGRDTGVLLLADISTSIMQQAADGDGRVVDRLKAALLMFAVSLDEVGDPYAIAGFASKYRDAVSYYPIKEFTQPWDSRMQAAVGGLSGRLATRMGAAIRHACVRMQSVGTARRLLLILSDGRPADYDDGGDERYLHEDTRMAIREAAAQGIHAFCVTLDPAGGAYLEQIFGRGHYLVIDQLNDLPARLPQVYLRLRHA